MKIDFEYNNQSLSSYQDLISQYPPSEFDSPYRSTIPMLCFWRDPDFGLAEIAHTLQVDPPAQMTLSFEYCVDVQKGKGRPSQTDLMLISDQYSVAIEAKYTEPPYDKVKVWLGQSDNKRLVLEGWLDLINAKAIDGGVRIDDIRDLPYQMIHRLASSCFLDRTVNILAYQCFDLDSKKIDYYRTNLNRLINLFNMPDNFSAFLINQPLRKSSKYQILQNRWQAGERRMADAVRSGMKSNNFICFGDLDFIKIV